MGNLKRLISAGGGQSIRFWDTSNWTETQVKRDSAFARGAKGFAAPIANAAVPAYLIARLIA
jgi:hypothetical protein